MRELSDPIMPEDIHKFLIENKESIITFLQNISSTETTTTSTSAAITQRKSRSASRSLTPMSRERRSPSNSLTLSPPLSRAGRRACTNRSAKSRSSERKNRRSRSRSRSASYDSRIYQQVKLPRRYYNTHKSEHRSRHRDRNEPRSAGLVSTSDSSGYESARWRSPRRSPGRNRPSHVSSSRGPPPSRCLGVFGMNPKTDERDLSRIFSEFGKVEQVQIIRDRFTSRSRGFGFVYFRDVDDAQVALPAMANAVIDNYKVRVDFSLTNFAERDNRY